MNNYNNSPYNAPPTYSRMDGVPAKFAPETYSRQVYGSESTSRGYNVAPTQFHFGNEIRFPDPERLDSRYLFIEVISLPTRVAVILQRPILTF